jgi:hypothetical protein
MLCVQLERFIRALNWSNSILAVYQFCLQLRVNLIIIGDVVQSVIPNSAAVLR